jgi:carnitine monooxygenase subunit
VLAFQLKGPHRMFSFAGEPSRKTAYSKPIECLMQSSAAGPWNKKHVSMPPGLNPTRAERYGFDSFQFFPNFVLIFSASGFSLHTHWPPVRTRTSSRPRCTAARPRRTASAWRRS